MTNKPMLSVERELRSAIEQALLAIKRVYQAGHESISAAGGSCDQPGIMFESDPTVRDLRALLDKPEQPSVSDLLLASAHSYVKIAGETQNLARHLQSRIEVYFDGDPGDQQKDDPVACVIAFREGVKEPEILSWNQLPVGEHRLYTEQSAPVDPESTCTSCDGSGEYIDAIGDWRGYCKCPAGVVAKNRTYPHAPSSAELDIESAAKKLAECMDYPWQHMTDQGRQSMRDFAKLVIEAGAGVKP